ncbi:beta-lactamase/transpeptidase-like protein [Dactylonectria estremocensis]|uniref:Beta-lactamase/transpeptidase-like protein n=1 Tax=Dactylonectria estremocensis TaxID=1079267 RepID=A0A9P9E9G4_9HYPO|nr:beta-lactamase/transpeptidase-like protein [Dactylonectria estremocensis]
MYPSITSLLACCLSLCSVAQSVAIDNRAYESADTQAYYNVKGSDHAKRAKSLSADGYQIVSLSTYGSPPHVKYAAVWSQREGNPFEIIHGANKTAYDSWLESWKAKGYVSTQVSATGPGGKAVFAGVVEKTTAVANWIQVCDLTNPWGFENSTDGIDMAIKGFRMYGTPSDRRYCVLGHENVGNQQSTIFYTTSFYTADYSALFQSETQKRFWRPSKLWVSEDHIITPQFVDTDVGRWAAVDDLTAAELAKEIKKQKQNGLVPVELQGGGDGKDARFAAIFVEHHVPSPRKWTAKGSVKGFKDNTAARTRMDGIMKTWMQKTGVRQAQVAVAQNGSIVAERSYTWAESNRAVVKPDDIFLLASLSKMFVHAAIYNLIEAGSLNYSTQVYPLLGYTPVDARADNITIRHLLEHTGGYDRDQSGDPTLRFRDIAIEQSNGTRAADVRDLIEYMVARPLDFTPGEGYGYSNYGSTLLGYIASNVTNTPYLEFLKKKILNGLNVQLYRTAAETHAKDRIVQESKYTGLDPVHPLSSEQVPGPHGGDGAIKEATLGAFSLAASASTIAKFIGSHAVWGEGGRSQGSRDGSLVGARAYSESRSTLDWAVTLNTREYGDEQEFNDLVYYQMPSFVDDAQVA